MKERKPGEVREGRIPIYDHQGHMRGHVGPNATSVTVARFINQHGAKLGTKDGRQAWIGPVPPPPPPPQVDPAVQVAQIEASKPKPKPEQHKLEISLKADKGSAKPIKAAAGK